jgi:tol-pal system protein YbgF
MGPRMTRRHRPALAFVTAAASSLVLAGCMGPVKPDDPVYAKLGELEQRLDHIERVVNNQSLLELAQRLDDVRAEVDALRGELETLQHDADQGRERDKALTTDLDERLRALEAAGAGAAAGKAATAAGGDQVAYDAAFELLKQARYEQAREAFAAFLKKFPDSTLRDNAQFWLGETWYVSKGFKAALAEFQKVIKDYPDSNKLPDAWLRVGYCNAELGQDEAARKAFATVTEQFPESEAAKRALARLKQMSAEKK